MSSTIVELTSDRAWFTHVTEHMNDDERYLFTVACKHIETDCADLALAIGEPYWLRAKSLAQLLTELKVDAATLIASMVANPTQVQSDKAWLMQTFGSEITQLVDGYRTLLKVSIATRQAESPSNPTPDGSAQTEMLRKMLLAMASDLRIVFMRLGSRLLTLRWYAKIKQVPADYLVEEALELYAPLANRLGIWQLKWELEDLSFRFKQPTEYKAIAKLLEEKRVEREAFIHQAIIKVTDALRKEEIHADVSGRPKHIYSIWNKMRNKGSDFSKLYDLRAFRIIVDDVRSCYTALGVVHQLWTPNLKEFDDYISRPKPNGYQSLHTIVIDTDGRPFEVQIRTHDMHQFAEYGVAAHWHYKESGAKGGKTKASSDYDKRLSWVRQVLDWKLDLDPSAKRTSLQNLDSHIYVLTPQAKVVELPENATPIDFAYSVHTDLGHRCRGARVNGQMVSLNTRLESGQTVEIIATKSGGPSRDWLNPNLGFLASHRSKAKVRQWFNAIDLQERIAQGHALVEKELQRLGKTSTNLESLAQAFSFATAEDLYVAVAKDEFSLRTLETFFVQPQPEADITPEQVTKESRQHLGSKSGVLVVGVDSLMTQLAKCCRPAPPDNIVGFVTRGRGVSIHRQDCSNFISMKNRHAERVIDVTWGNTHDVVYSVEIFVLSNDRHGLLRDITDVFARQKLNVVGVNTQSKQQLARMYFTVEVSDAEQLNKALLQLKTISDVLEVSRK